MFKWGVEVSTITKRTHYILVDAKNEKEAIDFAHKKASTREDDEHQVIQTKIESIHKLPPIFYEIK